MLTISLAFYPFSYCNCTIKHRHGIPSHPVLLSEKMMALLQLVVTLITCIAAVDSAANVTSCTSLINDQCWQNRTSCPQSPCSMLCGMASPQRSCIQECIAPRVRANQSEEFQCGALECQATQLCEQVCKRVGCKSLTCTAGDCFQECLFTSCGRML